VLRPNQYLMVAVSPGLLLFRYMRSAIGRLICQAARIARQISVSLMRQHSAPAQARQPQLRPTMDGEFAAATTGLARPREER
jgi:hypothetical protein